MKQPKRRGTYGSSKLTRVLGIVGLFVLSQLGTACAPETVTTKRAPKFQSEEIKTIAILPFDSLKTPQRGSRAPRVLAEADVSRSEYGSGLQIDPPPVPDRLTNQMHTVPPGAAERVTSMVWANLRFRPGIRVISPEQSGRTISLLRASHPGLTTRQIHQELGKHLSADGIVFGQVRIYREREGSKLGANPAAVGFDVKLISGRDGSMLWAGDYYEEQKPLIEDFRGFVERRGKFVTVEELAQFGVNRVMAQFPVGQ